MNYPKIVITEEGKHYLEKGQMWMYRNNLAAAEDVQTGDIVCITDVQGNYIATGFYHASSHIAARILTRNQDEVIDRAWFEKRIRMAYEFRKTTQRDNLSNCRIIFSEADGLGGLIADRYNDVIVTQVSSYGMDIRKDMIYDVLLDVLRKDGQKITAVYERNDIRAREKEGLKQYKGFWKEKGETKTVISENGLLLNVDIENGQKTGYFLDQKSNRVLLRNMSFGKKVLDCFTHTGGFALNAAYGGAEHVTAVDVSETALHQAYENAVLNHLEDRCEFVQADVFDYLETIREGQFDIIVLDPPAFTKSRRTVDHAYQGYKRINEKAMRALRNGGYLVTCSCSRYMETALFESMLKDAAKDAGVVLKQVSVTQQNSDHPILWTMDETSYLKFFIFQII